MAACVNHFENAQTDKFVIKKFDHLEYTVQDAKTAAKVFKRGLGMTEIGESRKETGNHTYCSYVLQSNDVKFVFTAPYLAQFTHPDDKPAFPKYDSARAVKFFTRHGAGVSAIGIEVDNAEEAYRVATKEGANGVTEPVEIFASEEEGGGSVVVSEITMYQDPTSTNPLHTSDTVLRFIQYKSFKGPFLPGYRSVNDPKPLNYGMTRMDHVVGNVYDMEKICSSLKKFLGFHTFAAFTKEDIQTPWTSLNSEVLANNNLRVLLPINESAPGKKESQILEYLKAYNGPGVQHIAIKSDNIFETVRQIRENSDIGFDFIPTPPSYYEDKVVMKRMADHLSKDEIQGVTQYGILVDLDDEGVLLQIFTKPLFDRPTLFIEIIQRKCLGQTIEVPGCGGFGKGNFKALFEAIERLQALRGGLLDTQEAK